VTINSSTSISEARAVEGNAQLVIEIAGRRWGQSCSTVDRALEMRYDFLNLPTQESRALRQLIAFSTTPAADLVD